MKRRINYRKLRSHGRLARHGYVNRKPVRSVFGSRTDRF